MSDNIININSDTKQIDFLNCQNLLLDTCSAIKLSQGDELTVKFLTETLKNNIGIGYSIKTLEEITIYSESQNIPYDKRQANKFIGNYINKSEEQADRIINKINKFPNVFKEPVGVLDNEIIKKAKQNKNSYKLKWGDAVIYTIAEDLKFDGIITHDSDFSRVNSNMRIFKLNNK